MSAISEFNLGTNVVFPVLLAFFLTLVQGPIAIPLLHKLKFGQYEREEGMASHQKKAGTPTMGGIMFLLSVMIVSLLFLNHHKEILPVLMLMVGFGLIGLLDDLIKEKQKHNLGLKVWQKMALQIVLTGVFCWWLLGPLGVEPEVVLPFSGGKTFAMPVPLYVIFLFFCVIGTVNGTNFTDGLDGLASSVTIPVAAFFAVAAFTCGSGAGTVGTAFVGALMGFLIFNAYPAKVFMGDTGSLAIGGFVAGIACLLKLELFIPIVGFIYLLEVVSVILQVSYFKLTHGKRIFKMSPIHHHFELCGWSETRVATVFSSVTALLALVALLGL